MAELSPAAQAVREAAKEAWGRQDYPVHTVIAALRALANQVVPAIDLAPQEDLESRREAMIWGMKAQAQLTRQQILAIAAELEGGNG